jgi:acyl transferase domain-containing protein
MAQNPENGKSRTYEQEPIAIIGIGCRFPGGANSPEKFWKLLRDGVNTITEVPADRWHLPTFYDPDPVEPGKIYSRWGAFIEQIHQFDAKFFGISRQEAVRMDPQQRLMLEVVWEALEDAGQPLEQVSGTNTGVFIGVWSHDYSDIQLSVSERNHINAYSGLGSAISMVANRISHIFDFKGASISVNTACSSSLVAVHLACCSLWRGECNLALAGGVNAILKPETVIAMSKAFLLSADGCCKSFDARADGYVNAEGAGIVVLKPLSSALANGDPIYALIRGSAMNHDGRTSGITVPNGLAQEAAMREAYRQAGILPQQLQYVEAQGTGTIVGDSIEANAVGAVVGINRPSGNDCILGSVKTNIGHLASAAGISGLIKTALALKHCQIPPNLHFQTPNPKIPFEKLRLRVPHTLESWSKNANEPRLAGVNSFGIGGTNCHVILEGVETHHETFLAQPPDAKLHKEASADDRVQLFLLSARSPKALQTFAQAYLDFLADENSSSMLSLPDICYTASMRRSHHDHRLALVVCSKEDLVKQLKAFLVGEISPNSDNSISECLALAEGTGEISPQEKERVMMLESLGKLYRLGNPVDWNLLYPKGGRFVRLPSYPWQKESYWHESKESQQARLGEPNQSRLSMLEQLLQRLESINTQDSQGFWEAILAIPPDEIQPLLKSYLQDLVSTMRSSAHFQQASEQSSKQKPEFLQKLEAVDISTRRSLLVEHLRSQLAKVVDLELSEDIDLQQGFFSMGMNSLKSLELRNQLKTSLGCSLPATWAFDYPTIEALVNYLAKEMPSLGLPSKSVVVEKADEKAKLSATLEELSIEEVADMLAQELAGI